MSSPAGKRRRLVWTSVLLLLLATTAHAAHICPTGPEGTKSSVGPCSLCLTPAAPAPAHANLLVQAVSAALLGVPAAPLLPASVFFVLHVRPPPAS